MGTLARYGLNLLLAAVWRVDFPWGTTAINALGCLLFGVVLGLIDHRALRSEYGPILMVGFLGAFTTFSTFAAEAMTLLRHHRWVGFGAYLVLQNGLGLTCIWFGTRLAR